MLKENNLELNLIGNKLQVIDHDTYKVLVTDLRKIPVLIRLLQHVAMANPREPDHTPPPDSTEMRLRQVENTIQLVVTALEERMQRNEDHVNGLQARLDQAEKEIDRLIRIRRELHDVFND